MNTPPNVCRLSQRKISGCAIANSTTARDSSSLSGNAPAPSCFESGAQEHGKLRLRSVWLSERKCGDGTLLPSKFSIMPSG